MKNYQKEALSICEYEGKNITFQLGTGDVYVNLTEVAKAFPKKNLTTIVNSLEIKEYCESLSKLKNYSLADLLIVKKGGNNPGTWAHQKVALRVAQKLSPDFAVWVDTRIEELLQHGYTKLDSISRKDLAKMLLEAEEEKERLQLTIHEQEKVLEESAPKVKYYKDVLSSAAALTVNSIAQCLGISGLELNKLLCQWKVQYKQSGVYYLYSELRPLKYAAHYSYVYTTASGNVITKNRLKWTEKGKEFIINLYNQKMKNAGMERVN